MAKITRFVIWICSKFTHSEIEQIIQGLLDVLANRNPEVKPKDHFKEQHPNYRNFYIDPLTPLTHPDKNQFEIKEYKLLLQEYQIKHNKALATVQYHSDSVRVPSSTHCPYCHAPSDYIYYNNGNKRSQFRCKVCSQVFKSNRKNYKTNFFCPYCQHALFKWKDRPEVTIYKCPNDNCPHRLQALAKLNLLEKIVQKARLSQFKLTYQYRDYHFQLNQIQHSCPEKNNLDLLKIQNSQNTLGLVLTFYVSYALSARKTALILKQVFNIKMSYQTVLNYAQAAAFYCHQVNFKFKDSCDDILPGDETYIKIKGIHYYVFFFLNSNKHSIAAYHLADNRGVLPAICAMKEAIRTAKPEQTITLISDGNPSYPAGIHFLNALSTTQPNLLHHKVIGLQNLDSESEQFRPFKQLIERLNRTYKHHIKPSAGFNSTNGAIALTTLFVTHYNFLRPHMALNYQTPISLPELDPLSTIQAKWTKILSMAV